MQSSRLLFVDLFQFYVLSATTVLPILLESNVVSGGAVECSELPAIVADCLGEDLIAWRSFFVFVLSGQLLPRWPTFQGFSIRI